MLTYLGLRAARDRVGPLKLQRQRVEDALERVAARPPAFARQGVITALLAQASTRGLPLLIIAGWVALTLYTLGLPLPTDSKSTSASVESAPDGDAATTAPPKAARPAAAPAAKAATGPRRWRQSRGTRPNPPLQTPANESPLLNFFRRAVNTPPAVEPPGQAIKP